MMRRIASLLAVAVLAASAGAVPGLASTLSGQDQQFLTDTAQGAAHELAISKLAAERAQQPTVRSYASMVVWITRR